jgi:hypothetical protein
LGEEIDMRPATEPTDIIWEHRHITGFEQFQRSIIVAIGCVLLLFLSFYLIFSAQKNALYLKRMYPKQNCNDFIQEYQNKENIWQKDAINEFIINTEIEEGGGDPLFTGPMQCFCKEKKKQGAKNNEVYTLSDVHGKKVYSGAICEEYFSNKIKSKLYGLSITFFIIGMNIVLKLVIIRMVSWIGIDTISEQMGVIAKVVFLAQFFNTGLIILIVNANMEEHQPHAFFSLFRGPFADYMP